MSDDMALFGDDAPPPAPQPVEPAATPAADWQIDLLRKALDARGLVDMADRQRAIEDAAGHPVESLRALTHEEALSVLSRLGPAPEGKRTGSTWDQRDEDTWIDRL